MKVIKCVAPLKDLYRQSACQANQLAAGIYTAADSPFSRLLSSELQNSNYTAIVSASVNPMDYGNAEDFRRDYLCAELMSKFPSWDLGINRSDVALRKFEDVELALRSLSFSSNPKLRLGGKTTTMRAVEETARRKIARVLGTFEWDEAVVSFAFGPGASTSLPRARGDAAYKYGAKRPQMSYNLCPIIPLVKVAVPYWDFDPEVVVGSKITTVPKNAKTDRVIAIEPDLNMFVQKGIGKMIRRRLQRWGLLRYDAQEVNQRLACEGSALGNLCTIDLSSASDSIHMEVVRLLVPPDWVTAIETSRSPIAVLPSGEKHILRKVSSMGNGFTFELETLVFWALSSAVVELLGELDTRCQVFGDDIIVSSRCREPVEEVLRYFGFTTNAKKTFSTGPFRESCGKHYFSGHDVTPFYVKAPIDTILRIYWAANTIKRHSRCLWGLDSRYKSVFDQLVSSLPPFWRNVRIPEGYGDGGLVSDFDEVCPSRASRGIEGWKYRSVVTRNNGLQLPIHGTLLKVLHYLEQGSDDESIRPDLTFSEVPKAGGYRFKANLVARQWESFGTWL